MSSSFALVAFAVLILLALNLHPVDGTPSWAPKGWGYAHATFYGSADGRGTEGGACAYQNTFTRGYGAMTTALSSALFREGAACGACFQLRCVKIKETPTERNWCWNYARTLTITATNLCPSGSEGGWCNPPKQHFDLSMPAFSNLAKFEGGVVPVFYRRYLSWTVIVFYVSCRPKMPMVELIRV